MQPGRGAAKRPASPIALRLIITRAVTPIAAQGQQGKKLFGKEPRVCLEAFQFHSELRWRRSSAEDEK